ncbi:MBG domain-containing protein [Mucilaginibacter dorajii]|uniref:Uncharacterized protein n=1 Tax=Mucilaginibacter dorajii TaxID=692994 RepID=A0ABP7P7Y2_9SPHI|nr:MBG domain-containing protein [Mucilaginibacter dorajii]MCS3736596.1 gliding motility-associated-like protein [Mucilaginibacter dorajii]
MKKCLLFIAITAFLSCLLTRAGAQTNQHIKSGDPTTAVNFPAGGCVYTWTNNTPGIGLAASGSGNIPSFTGIDPGTTPITATITASPVSSGFGYIANLSSNTVSVISTATNALLTTIPVGIAPIAVVVSPDGSRAYVVNNGSASVSIINTATNEVISTIGVAASPNGVAISPNGRKVYVVSQDEISVIDVIANAVSTTFPDGSHPTGISVSVDGTLIYVTNGTANTISVMEPITGTLVKTITVGTNPLTSAVSPDGKFVYVTNQSSAGVSVVSTTNNQVTTTIPLSGTPAGIVFSPDGTRVYVTDPTGGQVFVINTAINAVTTSISIPTNPQGISINQDGSRLYVTDRGNAVSVINTANNAVIGTITVGQYPVSIGNFITPNLVCNGQPVSFSITVDPIPIVITDVVSGHIATCKGTPSPVANIAQFPVSGSGVSADITVTAPTDFEVSVVPGSGYSNTVALKQTGGVVNNTVIYVRASAQAAAGNIAGNVIISTAGVPDRNIAVTGVVNNALMVNTVASQSLANGEITKAIKFTGNGSTFSWVNNTPGIGLAATGTGDIAAFKAINTTGSPITATITVTPLQPPLAYITNYWASSVSVVNTVTNKIISTIPTTLRSDPFYVAISADGSRLYVSEADQDALVINTATNTVITSFYIGGQGLVLSPDGSKLYSAQTLGDRIGVYNTATNTLINTINMSTAWGAEGLAISPDGSRLYVTSQQTGYVSVFNATTGAPITTIKVGLRPWNIAISPDGSRVYVTNINSNSVSVINTVTNAVIATIPVGANPEGVTVSPDGSRVYVAVAGANSVAVIDAASNAVIATVGVGLNPFGISVTPDGKFVYVVNQVSSDVTVISTATNTVSTTIQAGIGNYPTSLGNFISNGSNICSTPVTFTITVNPTANITATVPLQALNTTYGTPSASTSFTVSGTNLSAGILVTPPAGFELSTDNITFTSTVTVGAAGSLNAAPVYIRLKSTTNAGGYAGNIVLSSAGAPATNVQMPNSMVTPAPLTILANNASKVYGMVLNSNITSAAFTVLGNGLKNGNTITTVNLFFDGGTQATDHVGIYETIMPTVPTGANGFLPGNYTITYIPGALSITPAPLTITATDVSKPYGTALTGLTASVAFTSNGLQNQENIGSVAVAYGTGSGVNDALGFYPGTITPSLAGGGTFDPGNYLITYKTGSITVTPPTGIIVSGTLNALNTIYGTPSVSTSFNVSGTGLSGGILITPPPGFEVGTNNSTFGTSVIIGQAGDVAATTVYIRLAATTPVGTYSGNISLTSGTANANEAMPASTVIATPLTIIANNKTKVAGTANPTLTVTYAGFVNNESVAQLVIKPIVSTTANTLSAAGLYPIMASGAASPNYIISYVDGVLTINPLPPSVNIPNAFTPNGDGTNDVWAIASLAYYPNNTVSIYNRYGQQLYHSAGYAKPWDGTYNGTRVPEAVYYYIIQLDKNQPALSGHVTVIR